MGASRRFATYYIYSPRIYSNAHGQARGRNVARRAVSIGELPPNCDRGRGARAISVDLQDAIRSSTAMREER